MSGPYLRARGKKFCPECGRTKVSAAFGTDSRRKDGRAKHCRACVVKLRKLSGETEKRRRRVQVARLATYGLTLQSFAALWNYQGGLCPICRRALKLGTGGHSVDHDHKTGETRGILCVRCNTLEGHIDKLPIEPQVFLTRLSAYLKAPPWQDVSVFA